MIDLAQSTIILFAPFIVVGFVVAVSCAIVGPFALASHLIQRYRSHVTAGEGLKG